MRRGCRATDETAAVVGREVAAAGSALGMDPEPDKYGLLERDLRASILALAAATRAAIASSITGFGGKAAGPAGRDGAAAEEAGAASGAREEEAGGGGVLLTAGEPLPPASRASTAAFFAAS